LRLVNAQADPRQWAAVDRYFAALLAPPDADLAGALAETAAASLPPDVVRGGAVLDAASDDPDVRGVRAVLDLLAAEPALSATAIQTVGEKGRDGFALAIVGEQPA
jgi:hypothetical protein